MGLCVKVAGIKLRNLRGDSDLLSEGDDDEINQVLEEGQADELLDLAKS